MALKQKKFEKMIRKNPISEPETYKKETFNEIRFNEIEYLKQRIFVNSLSHIKDDVLQKKCLDISTHYRLFKNDESYFEVAELTNDEKDQFEICIGECIQKECAKIVKEKECIPTDMLKLIEFQSSMSNNFKIKLSNLLLLLKKYVSNQKDINNSVSKLLDSSYINILEAQSLAKQIDVIKDNSYKLQNNIISKFSTSKDLYKSLEKYYNAKEKEYAMNLKILEDLKNLQDKYNQVDGPQFKALVKKLSQTQEMIKIKREMFNSY